VRGKKLVTLSYDLLRINSNYFIFKLLKLYLIYISLVSKVTWKLNATEERQRRSTWIWNLVVLWSLFLNYSWNCILQWQWWFYQN